MKKISTKTNSNMLKPSNDWNLPRISLPHSVMPSLKHSTVGDTHTMKIKVKHTSSDESGHTYKITHAEHVKGVSKPKLAMKKKRVPLKIV